MRRLPRTEKGASKIKILFQVSGYWYRPDSGQHTVPSGKNTCLQNVVALYTLLISLEDVIRRKTSAAILSFDSRDSTMSGQEAKSDH